MVVDDADGRLYEKLADDLIRFATVIAGPSCAEDVLADAVLGAFSNAGWKSVVNKRAYLYRSVLNEAISSRRSIDRRLRREAAAAPDRGTEEPADTVDVLVALRRITVRQRAVVYLTYWVGLEAREIAGSLGVSTRTVQRELSAARRRLEVLLG